MWPILSIISTVIVSKVIISTVVDVDNFEPAEGTTEKSVQNVIYDEKVR